MLFESKTWSYFAVTSTLYFLIIVQALTRTPYKTHPLEILKFDLNYTAHLRLKITQLGAFSKPAANSR